MLAGWWMARRVPVGDRTVPVALPTGVPGRDNSSFPVTTFIAYPPLWPRTSLQIFLVWWGLSAWCTACDCADQERFQ